MENYTLKRRLFCACLSILTLPFLLAGCATNNTKNNDGVNNASIYYIQANQEGPNTLKNKDSHWSVTTEVVATQSKPKTAFYNFTIHAQSEKINITDINYKYGSYGKWRIIEKKKYLNAITTTEESDSITINKFPITIKKTGIPHNQLLQLTFKTNKNETKYINLIFGVQKCLSKSKKEFVCF